MNLEARASERLEAWMGAHAEELGWVSDTGAWTWKAIAQAIEQRRGDLRAAGLSDGATVVIAGNATRATFEWLAAVGQATRVAVLCGAGRDSVPTRLRVGARVEDDLLSVTGPSPDEACESEPARERLRARGHSGLVLRTGGTGGTPKWVLQDWDRLVTAVVAGGKRPPCRILPLMRFDHIGGLDMLLRATAAGDTVVEPPAILSPDAIAATVARHRVEVLPATPTLLNLLLVAEVGRRHDLSSLRVIPHGAEPLPKALRERLAAAFPGVTFVERFGTTETGALPVERRGEGWVLRAGAVGYGWEVRDGELWVRSPAAAVGYLGGEPGGPDEDGWFRTGDAAERLPDGAIRLRGRREGFVNVGGRKVAPAEVEAVLLADPRVVDCRVFGQASALLGQVVAAEVVWRGGMEAGELGVKREVQAFVAERLERHQVPVVVRVVAAVETTHVGKKARRGS